MIRASSVLPHDLLWGMPVSALPAGAPGWVIESVGAGHPAVVRRALAAPNKVAVGIRGLHREQRYAAVMCRSDIHRCVWPEQLTHVTGQGGWPALQTLEKARPLLDAQGLVWGVTGSAGFELASGIDALHEHSDLDLIVRTPTPVSRAWAAKLLQNLLALPSRIDVQLQTPLGGLALAEWASASPKVLLKADDGARLVTWPWSAVKAGE
jgi:phosphoribosyl-dephospho-CoA transferase